MPEHDPITPGPTRRRVIQGSALGAALWAAPVVTTLASPAFAAGSGRTFVLDPRQPGLLDTGIDLAPGANAVTVTGKASPGGPNDQPGGYDADGKPGTMNDPNGYGDLPYPPGNYFVVYGRVGPNGPLFAIGTGTSVNGPGRLFTGYNDDGFSDNTGSFTVSVTSQ